MQKLTYNAETGESEMVEMTEAEITALVIPVRETTWDDIRTQREPLLTEADNAINAAQDNADRVNEKKWRNYRKQLRDVTNQSSPDAVVWPAKPESA